MLSWLTDLMIDDRHISKGLQKYKLLCLFFNNRRHWLLWRRWVHLYCGQNQRAHQVQRIPGQVSIFPLCNHKPPSTVLSEITQSTANAAHKYLQMQWPTARQTCDSLIFRVKYILHDIQREMDFTKDREHRTHRRQMASVRNWCWW